MKFSIIFPKIGSVPQFTSKLGTAVSGDNVPFL
jgi:hypothetical protein